MTQFTTTVLPDGTLPAGIRSTVAKLLREMAGERVSITLAKPAKRRSSKQNRFYFKVVVGVVRDWFREHGYNFDAEETHEWIVRRIWKHTEVVFTPDGEAYERRLSSTTLTPGEWEARIDLVRQFGAEHGFAVPYPREFME